MIINVGNRRKSKTTNKQQKIELEQHISPIIPAYLSYTDNGIEKIYDGEVYKNSNGYIGINITVDEYPVYTEICNTYNNVDNYSYIDKDGYERTFNKMETLEFNEKTQTYMGVITEVNYEDTQVEIFECE
jgi:hypothetical protein